MGMEDDKGNACCFVGGYENIHSLLPLSLLWLLLKLQQSIIHNGFQSTYMWSKNARGFPSSFVLKLYVFLSF
jgi:hypothetical protein